MAQPIGYAFGMAALVVGVYVSYFLYSFGSRDKRLKEWADKYGSIYSLKIGAATLILLNDKRTVHNLLDKRSAIYSDRPKDQQMITALKENFAFFDASPAWRATRKIAAHFMSPKNLDETIMAVQEAE
ncbi:uncharacterized protein N0V89_000852 [Didymosphaeria variabile]|uniref:Cytochrome P450 n=1 Tax=Didymosphaeria variabile TaxID=1932322 RepID=A0A9W9CG88_9PLEO|nr:uncharacterized protein N0V89_000852 [Didymosphaeria variabile]KAJ4360291.1 hypothetical protein N0V89_000852 [Didymosphaeria variabile]